MSLTPDDMVRMRRGGFKLREIAEKAGDGWTESKLSHLFRKIGVKPDEPIIYHHRNQRALKHNYPRELLHEMYWSCELSMIDIAYELDISVSTTQEIFRRYDISRRTLVEARRIAQRRHPYVIVPLLVGEGRERGRAKSAKVRARRRQYNDRRRTKRSDRTPEQRQADIESTRARRIQRALERGAA